MVWMSTCTLQNNRIGALCYFMTHTYIHAFTHTHIIFWWKAFYDTYPRMFWQAFSCYIPHTCTFLLKGSLCYLLTNIHILKGIFTLPIQHIHILKGIFCYIFIIYIIEKVFFAIYSHTLQGTFMLYIHHIYYWKGIFCHIFTHFARHFHAIYSTYLHTTERLSYNAISLGYQSNILPTEQLGIIRAWLQPWCNQIIIWASFCIHDRQSSFSYTINSIDNS